MRVLLAIAIAATIGCVPAVAEDDAAAGEAAARETRRLEDRQDTKDLLAAAKTSGGTTLAAAAGSLEASLLTRTALANAAAKLDIDIVKGEGPVLIVVDDEKLGTWDLESVFRRQTYINSQVGFYRVQIETAPMCKPAVASQTELGPRGGGVGVIPILSGLLGVLQQKTEISAVSTTATSKMLARATAGHLILAPNLENRSLDSNAEVVAYMLDDIPFTDLTKTQLHTSLSELEKRATCLKDYYAGLKPNPKKPDEVAKAAAIKSVIDRYEVFMSDINTANDAGESPLYRALRQEAIKDTPAKILRLKVETSGGTTLTRNNFFTLFGVPAVSVTGGLVISYVMTDKASSKILASGVMACPTTLARLSRIHSGTLLRSVGDPTKCY